MVLVDFTGREVETLQLGLDGYQTDLIDEARGASRAGELEREAGLRFFAQTTVPNLKKKLVGKQGVTVDLSEDERLASLISLGRFRRIMDDHVIPCRESEDLGSTDLCKSFFPLRRAVDTSFKKLTNPKVISSSSVNSSQVDSMKQASALFGVLIGVMVVGFGLFLLTKR